MRKITTEQFIASARKMHGRLYSYEDTVYDGCDKKIAIICSTHGKFEQRARDHSQRGSGCPKCFRDTIGWTHSKWSSRKGDHKVYGILCSMDGEQFVKIGKTTRMLHTRFSGKVLPYSYTKIFEIKASNGHTPYYLSKLEKRLHKEFEHASYKPKKSFSGMTECFDVSILDSDLFKSLTIWEQSII